MHFGISMISPGERRGEQSNAIRLQALTSVNNRKVSGEAKAEGHGDGPAITQPVNVPLRRWEDWERSRLRKLRREEKRRRDFERTHPAGYQTGEGYLHTRHEVKSYDGSDTTSVASSDDDHWGTQIGGYNEHNPSYPPPPLALPLQHVNASGETLGGDQLEAMLEVGFDDGLSPNSSTTKLAPRHLDRHQLYDTPVTHSNGYTALSRAQSPTSPGMPGNGEAISSGVTEWKGHVKKRSGGRVDMRQYGPLGPLDPGSRI
jgi:chitin synthase